MAGDWQNPVNPLDVNDSGVVSPLDALLVVNALNRDGSRPLPSRDASPPAGEPETDDSVTDDSVTGPRFLDVDGDNHLSLLDWRMIADGIERHAAPLTLSAAVASASDPNGNGVIVQPELTVTGQTLPGVELHAVLHDGEFGSGPPVAESGEPEVWLQVDASGQFAFTVQATPGLHTLRVEVTDPIGRRQAVEQVIRFGDAVLDFNAAMLDVIRGWSTTSDGPIPGLVVPSPPPMVARNLAMVHLAIHDAIRVVDQPEAAYHVSLPAAEGASSLAAAAAAAHRVASRLYPEPEAVAIWDATLAEALNAVPEGAARTAGLGIGAQVGDAILAWRAVDGSDASPENPPAGDPNNLPTRAVGKWNRTLPRFAPPLLPQWPQVEPFALHYPAQFRPASPPTLDSDVYAEAVDEVLRLGRVDSSERTAEQTEIAHFWADGGGTFTPPGHWNQIAVDVALRHDSGLAENARLLAMLNVGLADAGIASWDAKYHYDYWRPIDAIGRAEVDGNPATTADAEWLPLLPTPPFPTYTSGHSTFSGAADAILSAFFGPEVPFVSLADGPSQFSAAPLDGSGLWYRTFSSFADAANEAGRSRIYGGIHFEFDNAVGLAAGRAVGSHVVDRFAAATS